MVTGNFLVFSFPVYALLDPRSTLSFVTPLVACKFKLLPEILYEPFLVSTPIGLVLGRVGLPKLSHYCSR